MKEEKVKGVLLEAYVKRRKKERVKRMRLGIEKRKKKERRKVSKGR